MSQVLQTATYVVDRTQKITKVASSIADAVVGETSKQLNSKKSSL